MDVGRIHILVVDDVADMADSTVELLSIWGYAAVARYDGATALESVGIRRPDVVLLDLAMPRMDGFRFAGLFRDLPECGSVPIIAVSGYSTPAYQARAQDVEIHHYLLKPIDPTRLKEMLARTVEPTATPAPPCRGVALSLSLRRRRWVPGSVKGQSCSAAAKEWVGA